MENKLFSKKRVSLYTIMACFGLFLFCLYSFNMGIIDALFANYVKYVIVIIAEILIFVSCIGSIKNAKDKKIKLLITLVVFAFIVMFGNGDLINHRFWYPVLTICLLFNIYALSFRKDWQKIALYIIVGFVFEHIIATFFCAAFPNIYMEKIFPLFLDNKDVLMIQFNKHQIAGITPHYSTNALYLVTGLIVNGYMVFFADKKTKKSKIFWIAILGLNIIALLLTGKRAQVVFFAISAVAVLLLKNRNSIFKFVKKGIAIIIGLALVIWAISFSIPSITNSFTRSFSSLSDSNVMDSRNLLYDFAWDQFKGNELFGIGWSNYQYQYEKYAPQKEMNRMHVHCIYLQLLCECGVLGAIIVFALLIMLLVLPIRDIMKHPNSKGIKYVYLFLWFHIYMLLEGILGNSLYDMQIFIPYCFVLAIFASVHFDLKKELPEHVEKKC